MITSGTGILPVDPDGIPPSMRDARRWLGWKATPAKTKDGEDYLDKVPKRPHAPDQNASSTNPDTWGTFNKAVSVYQRGSVNGIGFALCEGWFGVDLDGVIDPETNEMEPAAKEIVSRLNTYTEVSPSGTGVKCFLRGHVPESKKGIADGMEVEVYGTEELKGGRYFTVTGQRWPGTPDEVAEADDERMAEVMRLLEQILANRRKKNPATVATVMASTGVAEDDEELIEVGHRICRNFAALWNGSVSAHGDDESAADLALASYLAFLAGPNQHARVRRLMLSSKLKRDKWSANRTYLNRTIDAAFDGKADFYNWEAHERKRLNGHVRTEAATKKAEQREKKKAEQATAVIEAIGTNAAEPLDLRKPHTHDEVSCARRLAAAAAGSLRYVAEWRKWIQFDGQRWRIDDGGAAIEAAKRLRDSLWSEMPTLTRTEAEAAITFVKGMGASKRLAGVVMLASSEPAIRVHAEELDRHPMLLNLRNGILDLNTLEMRPHDPTLLITQVAGVSYGETAESELWERFINEATDGNEELAAFLQRAAGVSLTGSVRDEVLYCHHGRGANGKSTYLDALRHVLGDYAAVAPPSFLAHRGTEGHPTEVAMMHGKRLVAAIEMEAGTRMRESFVKSLTGGDAIQARRMREDFWTVEPQWKLHVSFNDPPRVTGTDDGIRRRLCVIPWLVRFDGARRDSTLKERLCADGPERAGILNWAIGGLRAWQLRGLDAPACVKAFTEEFTRQQDSFGQFIDERCDVAPGHRVESQTFYREFHEWLERRGESTTTWTSNRVANELQRRGFVKEDRRTGGIHRGKYFYAGLGLLSAHDE